jgi:two-component system, OmpR family, osmolarity sensor histidine kinase EnvZ
VLTWLRRATLRQRIGAIIELHALMMGGTLALFARLGPKDGDRLYLMPEPDRVAAIVTVFERAPPETYPDLLRAFHDDRQSVRLLDAYSSTPDEDASPQGEAKSAAARYHRALGGRPFRIEAKGHDILSSLDEQPRFSSSPFRVIVALPNGKAVEMQRAMLAPISKVLNRLTIIGLVVIVLDILVIFWLASLTTGPVERLARAVRRDDPRGLISSGPREMVELSDAFRQMRARLHALLEERTRIIAAVAHDFRTYLTRLELRSDFIDDPEQRRLAEGDLNEMRMLIDDALTFAQPGPEWGGQEAEVDLCDELEDIIRTRRQLGERITLATDCSGWRARTTPLALRRMLANLLDNAGRYGGGSTTIALAREDGTIFIGVEDDGPGVPEERLSELIEPFMRLESSRARHTGGVGLGLSIVQALAHRFGGTLRLENRREGGLRAVLTLPDADGLT